MSRSVWRDAGFRGALACLALGASLEFPRGARADEGMWTMDNLPLSQMKSRYGFSPSPEWIEKVTKASARLALGCSASFVSQDGLVMTNHHCANECLQQLSDAKANYFQDGFTSRSQPEEPKCPAMELDRLDSITDVTERMGDALKGKEGRDYTSAKQVAESALEKECAGSDTKKWRCDIVTLYHGGRSALYRYRRYQDVRMVMAPDQNAAFFGGDPDNFNFPRYDLDMAFLRVYEDEKPAKTPEFFAFDPNGPKEGQLVFTSGNPGSTQREETLGEIGFARDITIPFVTGMLSTMDGALWEFGRSDAQHRVMAQEEIFGIENGLKVYRGRIPVLADPKLVVEKAREQADTKSWIEQNPQRQKLYGDPWKKADQALAVQKEIFVPYMMLERGSGFQGQLFSYASVIVRGVSQREKPDGERLVAYHDAKLPVIQDRLSATIPVYPELEELKLGLSLTKLRQMLGADDPLVKKILGTQSPEELAASLVSGSQLADPEVRLALWKGGRKAVEQSTDPLIVLARLVEPEALKLRHRMDDEVEAPLRQAHETLARIRFAREGTASYPDATFTQRISFGQVKGWTENGKAVAPFTYFSGLYDRATGADPFRLTSAWINARKELNLKTPFDFVTTNDIIGGNSGSPVIDEKGHAVGLIFDGNIHSLGGDFYYDGSMNRAVAVDAAAIIEALRVVYKNRGLADELVNGHL
ncbi:S46 family peptidase [Acetobacter sp. AN02]|uniref:S46 family peptidase n=1 Tax=Acetobacter sp. AN02 TaxID=2894186 RepID=UPI0024343B2C|nr:S46 family peptidase [Acetobacter sp. AN02]MDG6094706.1 S46 family peptidase [Acetobacter sp. AN02]